MLAVFMLQNTGSVQVSFLWMDGSAPLAIVLLIAGVGASLLTMMVGADAARDVEALGFDFMDAADLIIGDGTPTLEIGAG